MKTKQELDALKGKLSVPEQEQIASLARLVTEFSEKKVITFEGYNTLKNISSELNTIKENYTSRLFNLLKQGNMIED